MLHSVCRVGFGLELALNDDGSTGLESGRRIWPAAPQTSMLEPIGGLVFLAVLVFPLLVDSD